MRILILLLAATTTHGQTLLSGIIGGNASTSQVATPTDSPGQGTYGSTQSVTLSDGTSGATICYTIDGSTPGATVAGTCNSSPTTTYSTAISVSSTTTIKAIGTKSGMTNSGVLTSVYTISAASPIRDHSYVTENVGDTTPAITVVSGDTLIAGFYTISCPNVAQFSTSPSTSGWKNYNPPNGGASSTIYACIWVCPGCGTTASYTLSWLAGAGYYKSMSFASVKSPATLATEVTWNSGSTYAQYDLATDNLDGFTYASIQSSNTNHQPSTQPTWWTRLAQGAGSASASTQQGGSVTPPAGSTVIISIACGNDTGSTYSVDSGFTLIDSITGGATWQGGGWAVLEQASPAAVNPTWTMNGGNAPRLFAVYNIYLKYF